jgi:hypothetical protein
MIKERELARLSRSLFDSGIEVNSVYSIMSEAESAINSAIDELVLQSLEEAIAYAEDSNVPEFAEDVMIVDRFGIKQLESRSGDFFYSKSEIKNLNNLIKNGKVSKDGSKYKVIPVGKKTIRSSFDDMKARQNIQSETRAAMLSDSMNKRIGSISESMSNSIRDKIRSLKASASKEADFKTASSKQDENSSWVIPARDADLNQYVNNLNQELEVAIESVIMSVVDSFIAEVQ